LNVLVNNAGIQNWMGILDNNFYEKANNEIIINAIAPLHLTNLFIQLNSLRTIMIVTSALAFVPLTKVPVYCATKAFFHSFTHSIRHLLRSKNIFIEAIFKQPKEGKIELTFGFSEILSKASPEKIQAIFTRMNQ
jgi:uncharacterized oxidoreductase